MGNKEYVEVIHCFGSCGLEITELIWRGTRHFVVERILHTCSCIDDGISVIRYTVLIQGEQKYIYCDSEKRWYVRTAMLQEVK